MYWNFLGKFFGKFEILPKFCIVLYFIWPKGQDERGSEPQAAEWNHGIGYKFSTGYIGNYTKHLSLFGKTSNSRCKMPQLGPKFVGTDLKRYVLQDEDHFGNDHRCTPGFPIRNSRKSPERLGIVPDLASLKRNSPT